MNQVKTKNTRAQRGSIHPLMATAAVAVTLVSLVGVAAITGVIPNSHSTAVPASPTYTQAPLVSSVNGDNRAVPDTANVVTRSPNYVAVPDPVETRAPTHAKAPAHVIKHAAPHRVASNHNSTNYSQQSAQETYQVAQAPAVCRDCGRVESVVALNEPAKPSGLGIAAGAVLGGILGNQVGGGNGKTLATVAGAVAGGYGGNEVEKRTRSSTTYQVRVKMDDGEVRTFPQTGPDGWHTGDRVRVVNGVLTARG